MILRYSGLLQLWCTFCFLVFFVCLLVFFFFKSTLWNPFLKGKLEGVCEPRQNLQSWSAGYLSDALSGHTHLPISLTWLPVPFSVFPAFTFHWVGDRAFLRGSSAVFEMIFAMIQRPQWIPKEPLEMFPLCKIKAGRRVGSRLQLPSFWFPAILN